MREYKMLESLRTKIKEINNIHDCKYYQELSDINMENGKIYCLIDPIDKKSVSLGSSKMETIVLHFIINAKDGFKSLYVIDEQVENALKAGITDEYIRGIQIVNSSSTYSDKYYGYVRDLTIKIKYR